MLSAVPRHGSPLGRPSPLGYWLAYGGTPGIGFLMDGFAAAMAKRGIGEAAQRQIFVETPAAAYAFIER